MGRHGLGLESQPGPGAPRGEAWGLHSVGSYLVCSAREWGTAP